MALALGIPTPKLVHLADNANDLWTPGPRLPKKGGGFRDTLDAQPELKAAHQEVKLKLLRQVQYPAYILGGIPSSLGLIRDYRRHAEIHADKRILISEDIRDFYPNTTTVTVTSIWQHFFRFSPEVANLLARLTTLKGHLPQGWRPSSYLANLVFWREEPFLVQELERRGFAYSRFMDDITVSSKNTITNRTKGDVVRLIVSMLYRSGYKQKRGKHDIATQGRRMVVTGLNVNGRRPTIPKPERNRIRAMVHRCETWLLGRNTPEYRILWDSTSGSVGTMKLLHPEEAAQLRARLKAVAP